MTVEELQVQKDKNSAAWHNATTQEEKDRLHQENVKLQGQIDSMTGGSSSFNSNTGKWTSTPGGQSSGGSSAPAYTAPQNPAAQGQSQNQPTQDQQAPAGFQGSASGVQTNTSQQDQWLAEMNANSIAWHTASPEDKKRLEDRNKELGALLGGSVTFDKGTGTWSGTAQSGGDATASEIKDLLDQWKQAAIDQNNASIDYNVQKAVEELERALADAQPQFKEQQEQVAKDEMQALDNSALYSEMRGDKGGIGKEQYSSIQNTAAQNSLAIAQAQTKLATDTQRQIADLRAQGEFEKANALLTITQNYLTQLAQIKQWAAEYNLSESQFQESIRQWEAEFQESIRQAGLNYDLSWAQLTGKLPDGTPTYSAQQDELNRKIAMGEALLNVGMMPTDDQISAMGMTREQAQEWIYRAQLQAAAGGSGGGGNGENPSGGDYVDVYSQMYGLGLRTKEDAYAYLIANDYTDSEASNLAAYYVRTKLPELQSDDGEDVQQTQGRPVENTFGNSGGGVPDSLFSQLTHEMKRYSDLGLANAALGLYDQMEGQLSEEQKKQLEKMFDSWGW